MTVGKDTDAVLSTDAFDISIDETGDILTEDFLDTALLMSIFAERRAGASEVPVAQYRGGWLGNESFDDNFEIGSKVWLYEQQRITRNTLNSINSAAFDGLKWLVTQGIAVTLDVETVLQNGEIVMEVEIFRSNSTVDRRFYSLWNNSGVTSIAS